MYLHVSLLETGLHRLAQVGRDNIYMKMPRNFTSRILCVFGFFGGGGHQSVRDRTAQAGAPIFKMHWHLYN